MGQAAASTGIHMAIMPLLMPPVQDPRRPDFLIRMDKSVTQFIVYSAFSPYTDGMMVSTLLRASRTPTVQETIMRVRLIPCRKAWHPESGHSGSLLFYSLSGMVYLPA
jgi:hypothetical protein